MHLSMENSVVVESLGVSDTTATSSSDDLIEPGIKGGEYLDNDLLADLDSYLEDLHDRLTISRMVSDSVIKGMVNAVTEEAEERISLKESEVASLNDRLKADKIEESGLSTFSDTVVEHDSMKECLDNLRKTAEEQFQRLEKEIKDIMGCNSIRRLNSGSELLGLSGILPEKVSEKWVGVDKTLNSLKSILKTVYERVDNMVYSSKPVLCEWQQEREFQEELEAIVIQTSIRSLQEEFEVMLWEQRAQFFGSQSINQLTKINELSNLRKELDAILRSLSSPETGQLPPHESHEGVEEWNNVKRKDPIHHEFVGNGKHEESKNATPETMDSAQLKHMSKDELINYFKAEMTKMKRNHESVVQEKTEENFRLIRKILNERGPSSSLKKDKEFDAFRKKIPEVILKLDDILIENEKLHVDDDYYKNFCSLKDRLDTLLSDNLNLRNLLINKGKEIKRLSLQVSEAAEKISHHSLTDANKLKQIQDLKRDIEDTKIEVSVREDIYKCALGEVMDKIKSEIEDSDIESITMQGICEIIFREAVKDAKATMKWDIADPDMEFFLMQEIRGIIFRETIKDAEDTINVMKLKYEKENERRISLEASLSKSEEFLCVEMKEKEQMKQEVASMEEKEKLALETITSLRKEKEHFDQIHKEFDRLRDQASQQEKLISESSRESNLIKSKLKDAMKNFKEVDEERKKLRYIIQEKQNTISAVEAKEMEHRKQIESIILSFQRLSEAAADFECRALENVEKNNLRLDKLNLQCNPLAQLFRRTVVVYKQKLERRYSDLQKAEAEVDLLGDEVDVLLGLLEKIYIALDHYSPILQHYPGIMEILKLVRRELSGETGKPV